MPDGTERSNLQAKPRAFHGAGRISSPAIWKKIQAGIYVIDSGPTDNIHLPAPECNRRPGFHRSELPARTEGASFTPSENAKARTGLSLDRFLRHLSVPCLLVA